jgi:hypothetical protein
MPSPFDFVPAETAQTSRPALSTAGRGSLKLGHAPSGIVKITDYAGELLAVYPTAFEPAAIEINGKSVDGVRADFLVCSGDEAGKEVNGALVIGKVLVSSLRRKVGEAVILKIGRGQPRNGNQPAWIPVDTTPEEDLHVAEVVAKVYK